jgi:hypothetical protein
VTALAFALAALFFVAGRVRRWARGGPN